ncbi:hypothetical protein K474DRAFT_1373407 [Panus rudis PR-1116 ss-1]|nr:hypothetical protein K474DRAFT_1373407 [Panus rudis PR-1116 ss-1]
MASTSEVPGGSVSPLQGAPGPGGSLPRGAACLPCRRRKMKCDGGKPACGQCVSKGRVEDCEYTTTPGPTRSQLLEENIAILEARIRELETPGESQSVRLHDPRQAASSGGGPSTAVFPAAPVGVGSVSAQLSLPQQQPSTPVVVSAQERSSLIDIFLRHANQLGFFLHIPRFLHAAYESTATGGTALLEGLLSAIYLWGSHFSDNAHLRLHENTFLNQAVQQITGSLFVSTEGNADRVQRSQDILYGLQAEVLLANYFLVSGRNLEGRYHLTAAVSLTLSCRLNYIRSGRQFGTQGGQPTLAAAEIGLVAPRDGVEEGERINAFWTIFSLDMLWAFALRHPAGFQNGSRGIRIDTPWPLSFSVYEQGLLEPHVPRQNTLQNFFRGVIPTLETPALGIRAQSIAILSRASTLANRYSASESSPPSTHSVAWTLHHGPPRLYRSTYPR